MPRHILPLILITMIFVSGCSRRPADPQLLRAAEIVNTHPDSAATIISAIDPTRLPEPDRQFRNLLQVKVADKAYITHTSDSLILSVLAYAESHPSCGFLPEAHYYAGRVLSDIGDYPTSLRHFQSALDLLPPSSPDTILRGNVLSQTARLLNTLRLYNEAIPYLEEVIRLERQSADTLNEVYDLQLLGNIYLRAELFDKADSCFVLSLVQSTNLPPQHAAKSRMYRAAVKYYTDEIDSARILINPTIDSVDSISRNSALGYATNIYLHAGILDSAYFCAHEIVTSQNLSQQHIGYQNLLEPELRRFIHPDTLDRYIWEYRWLLEHFYDGNAQQLAINQQAFYNYQLHERDKNRAQRSARILRRSVALCMILILILALIHCYLRMRSQARVIRLQGALQSVSELRHQLVASEARHDSFLSSLTSPDAPPPAFSPSEQELRVQLRNELSALSAQSNLPRAVPESILTSEAYSSILRHIADGRVIPDADPLWQQISEAVLAASPQFFARLKLLTLATLSTLDIHTALLIKCGFRPSQMTILLGRSNGAIISRRETLGYKIFDEKTAVRAVDAIIRLL